MKAARSSDQSKVEVVDLPRPPVRGPSEVIASVLYTGICKTDHHLITTGAAKGVVLGHEAVCRLEHDPTGRTYAFNNEVPCGECDYCAEGLTSHCRDLRELGVNEHGGYAEYIAAPRQCFFPIEVSDPALGVFAEPLACAVHAAERIVAARNALTASCPRVLIVGAGVSGQLIGYLLSRTNLRGSIYVYDPVDAHIGWIEALECTRVMDCAKHSAHIVIECSGTQGGLETALLAVRNGGIACIYGVPPENGKMPVSSGEIFRRELTVISSFAGCNEHTMSTAVRHIEGDEAFFRTLLGRFVTLEDVGAEIERWSPVPGTRTVVAVDPECIVRANQSDEARLKGMAAE